MNDVQLLLLAARTLISYPEDRELDIATAARDAAGREVSASSARAVRWCAYGAITAVTYDLPWQRSPRINDAAGATLRAAAEQLGAVSVVQWNRDRPHEDVMKMFDHAIELAE